MKELSEHMEKNSGHAARIAALIEKIHALRELVDAGKMSEEEILPLEVELLHQAVDECQVALEKLQRYLHS